jgi:drug/metabolite transporter (DMT)-like permease
MGYGGFTDNNILREIKKSSRRLEILTIMLLVYTAILISIGFLQYVTLSNHLPILYVSMIFVVPLVISIVIILFFHKKINKET